jgi:O-antigen/teichoic acid export membrane protein
LVVVTFVASLVNVGLNLRLIPNYGLVGAALAAVVALLGWNIVLWLRAWQRWETNS